jgi:hypothetical protein
MTRNTREYGGDIFSFRTAPATGFGPRETGRYAAFKVLGQRGESVCYAVLDGIFDRHPTLEQAAGLPYLRNTGFWLQARDGRRALRAALPGTVRGALTRDMMLAAGVTFAPAVELWERARSADAPSLAALAQLALRCRCRNMWLRASSSSSALKVKRSFSVDAFCAAGRALISSTKRFRLGSLLQASSPIT